MRKPNPPQDSRIDIMWETFKSLGVVVGDSVPCPMPDTLKCLKNDIDQIPHMNVKVIHLEDRMQTQATNLRILYSRVDDLSKMVHGQQAQFSFVLDQMFESLPQEARLKFVQKLAADGFDSDALRFTKRL